MDETEKDARKAVRFDRKQLGPIKQPPLSKYAQIMPHIMPVNGQWRPTGSLRIRDRTIACFSPETSGKVPLCDPLKSSVCKNTAYLGFVLNGARIGFRLDPECANPGSIRARNRVTLIGICREIVHFPECRKRANVAFFSFPPLH